MNNRLRFVSSILAIVSLLLIGGATTAAASGSVEPAAATDSQPCDGAGCFTLLIGQVDGQDQYYAVGAYLGDTVGTITVKLQYQSMVLSRTISCTADGQCAAITPNITKLSAETHELCSSVEFADPSGVSRLGPFWTCRTV